VWNIRFIHARTTLGRRPDDARTTPGRRPDDARTRSWRGPAFVVARSLLGGAFLVAAFSKAVAPTDTLLLFQRILGSVGLSGAMLTWCCVLGLVAYEVALGSCVVAGVGGRGMIVAALATVLAFTVFVVWLIAFHPLLSCGCGPFWTNVGGNHSSLYALARNSILILLASQSLATYPHSQ